MRKSLIKRVIIALLIVIAAFGVWRSFTSPSLIAFLVDLKEVLAQTNLPLFGLAIGVYLVSIPLAVLSWSAVLRMLESAVSVIKFVPILMAGVFVNNITPMSRAGGEIVRVYGLREKFRLPYTNAILSVALSRLIEMAPVGLIGIIGVFALIKRHIISWQQLGFVGIAGCCIAGIAAWGIYKSHCMPALWSRILGYFLRKEQRLSSRYGQVSELAPSIGNIVWSIKQKKAFVESILFSSVLWALSLVRLKLLAYALGIELSFSAVAAATVWYIVIGLFALTPGGIGIIEGGLVAAFVFMGVPPSQAFALTVLERAISYLLSTSIGAVCLLALGGRQLWMKSASKRSNLHD